MKLSNKILIGFFGFIFIYLTAAFTEIRLRGNPYFIDEANSITETAAFTGVRQMVLEDLGRNIHVYGSDSPRIEILSREGNLLRKLNYKVSGDTLSLTKMEIEEKQAVKISVYVPQNGLSRITVNGARVHIEGLEQKELSIFQHAGWISVNNSKILDKLTLEASNKANFTLFYTDLKTLSLLIQNSQVTIYSPVGLVEGSMTDDAFLRVTGTEEIRFKKDGSSQLSIN